MVVNLQLHVQSVVITTNVVSSNIVHSKLYSKQNYQQYFRYMEVVSFIGGGNGLLGESHRCTSLTNVIT